MRVCVQPRGVPGIPPGQLPDTPPFANSTTARAAATGGLDLRSVGRRATHARCAQTWRHAPQRRPSRRAQMPRGVSGLHGACVWQDAALTVFMPTDAAWLALCKGKQMMVDFLTGSAALRPTPNPTFPAPPRHPESTQTHSRTAQPHWLAQAQRIRTRSECPHACLCLPTYLAVPALACGRIVPSPVTVRRWFCGAAVCRIAEPGPGADVAGASRVPVQMWPGEPSPVADVAVSRVPVQMWAAASPSWCRCGGREPFIRCIVCGTHR